MDSIYDDHAAIRRSVEAGQHRRIIGGMWEEVGRLQFDFLRGQGLQPQHTLLDIGCGSLRGGVHFAAFLAPGNYWGIDSNGALLQAGWDHELVARGLHLRQPREQLVCLDDFQFQQLGGSFDFAIAQSVFTHLGLNRIRRCLTRVVPVLRPQARLFATFFELEEGQAREEPQVHQPGGKLTHSDRDPYHYHFSDLEWLVRGLPLRVHRIGDWSHPRDQRMACFTRQ